MTIKNLTPKAMQCSMGWCPSVHQRANGELLIVGRIAEPHEMAGSDVYRGDNEEAIIIAPALLDDVPRGWRTIDSAPRDGARILGGRHGTITDVIFWSAGNWFSQSDEISLWAAFPPTHWQPLPLPPTDREGT